MAGRQTSLLVRQLRLQRLLRVLGLGLLVGTEVRLAGREPRLLVRQLRLQELLRV